MLKYVVVFVAGIVFGQVGFSGVARMLDHGVDKVKTTSQEMAR